jgi:luciferase family oxidoreductase group 1
VTEHHNAEDLAGSSPEVLLAHLSAHTKSIRIGSGGVMLQHYSPYKVAENFNLLAALAPGRIDIGIGRAPGGLPLSTRALQAGRDQVRKPDFAAQLAELDAFLVRDAVRRPEGLDATPRPAEPGERYLLGASAESAALAAKLDWNFVFALHLNGDDAALTAAAATAYRDATGRGPIVAVAAVASASVAEAKSQADTFTPYRVHIPGAQSVTVGTEALAAEYAHQAGVSDYAVERRPYTVLAGTGDDVVEALDALAVQYGIGEFIIDFFNAGDSRTTALELVAAAHRAQRPAALSGPGYRIRGFRQRGAARAGAARTPFARANRRYAARPSGPAVPRKPLRTHRHHGSRLMSEVTPVTDADFVALRHRLHAAPELAYEEHETSALVASYLREWGYDVATGVGRTGVVGTLRHGLGERSVAIRADMDALPIEEVTGLAYASRKPGKMHACGHDGHTTINADICEHIRDRLTALVEAQAASFGATAEILYPRGYPVLVNHPEETDFARQMARRHFGEARIDTSLQPIAASEDFAFMLEERPGSYLFIGNGDSADLHNPKYDFNDEILADAARYWMRLVEDYLATNAAA